MDENKNFETEIDFKALPKTPSRLFGWIFPYYAALFLVVGIYFIKHMDVSSFNSVRAIYTDSLKINADVEIKKGGIMPAIDLGIILHPSSELVEKGKSLFKTNCASCHGDDGKGNGLAAAALNPPPRNFHNPEGWTNGREFNNMFTTLQKGVPGTGMIAYEFLPVEDRISIIQFIRTFTEFPAITEESVAQLDKLYDLSKGVATPNHISLEMAAAKIIEENAKDTSKINSVISKINSMQDLRAVELFNSFVLNKEKAISIFRRDFVNTKSPEEFVSRILTFPTESGFKPNTSLLSKEELNSLFRLLSYSIS